MLDVLFKKARGYSVEEVTEEYGFDEEGNEKLLKRKVQSKYIPPDLSAIKACMDIRDNEIGQMTKQQLAEEKRRLLEELKILQIGEQDEKKKR
ncbi:MAG: hypothetical protein PHC84_02195 [Clostridia bacterium]|nr:hypothetical protein [Clostridia bacterium]